MTSIFRINKINFVLLTIITYLSLSLSLEANAQSKASGTGASSAKSNSSKGIIVGSPNSTADELSAQAFLEDIMVKRYTAGLGTILDKNLFYVSVQMQLADAPLKKKPETPSPQPTSEMPADLMVGTLDPEKLIAQYSLSEEKPAILSLLTQKRIKAILISAGVKEEAGEERKAEVEAWIKSRVESEFKGIGKYEVTMIKTLPEKPPKEIPKPEEKPKTFEEKLEDFQTLAVGLIIAATALLSIILWRVTTSKINVNSSKTGESNPIKLQAEGLGGGAGATAASGSVKNDSDVKTSIENQRKISEDLLSLSSKLNQVSSKLNNKIPEVVRAWCQSGDEGVTKLVCFAEAVGVQLGGLSIPPESMKSVAEVFSKMASMDPQIKLKSLEGAYWDLVSVMNLGVEVLTQPFSYLSAVEPQTINSVLMEQNPKMKALVSLYLPTDVRKKYVKGLSLEDKQILIENAAGLSEISSAELRSVDDSLMKKVKGQGSSDVVLLDSSLSKVIDSLNITEELELLGKIKSPGILEFKRKSPSIAFLHEWPDSTLSILLSRCRSEMLVAYLSKREDQKDRFIGLCPPMIAELVQDDLPRAAQVPESEKEASLEAIKDVMVEMYKNKEVDLAEIFSRQSETSNVVNFKSA